MNTISDSLLATGEIHQTNRLLRLRFPHEDGPDASLLANRLDAAEGVSRDFEFTVEAISSDPGIALKDVLGKMVTIELVREDRSLRYFNGYVFEFRLLRADGGLVFYELVLRPWLSYLKLRRDHYLFHDKSLLGQSDDILADYPLRDVEFRINGEDPAYTDACQYGETDYNYLHRRWEQHGWMYWYEHRADGHTLVVSDDSTQSAAIDGQHAEIPFQKEAGATEDDALGEWTAVRRLVPASYAMSSFDFKNPRPVFTDQPSINRQGKVLNKEMYEFAGTYGFRNQGEGDAATRLRMEEIEADAKHFEGAGNDRTVQPGRHFELKGHFDGAAGGDAAAMTFLILEARHKANNNYQGGKQARSSYENSIRCIRNTIPWRPGRGFNSEEPQAYGMETALVVGPPGEEIYTDKYGRVRIQFHWDRDGKYDDKSSAWVRVATAWSGSNFGMTSIPRIGTEVIIQFLNGNPDRPLIMGMVPNADTMPPWDLPANKTQSGILSRSSPGGSYDHANAIRFEDKKGQEQLWLHAEKDQLTEVENDEDKWVGNDRRKTVDRDETTEVKRDRTETVGRDETITVHNNRSERVDHNETISIGDNRSEDVGKDEKVSIGGSRHVTVGIIKTETVALAKMLTIGGAYQTTVGAGMNTTVALMQAEQVGLSKSVIVGKKTSFTAGEEFRIEVGESVFVMKKDGRIEITGKEIIIRASKKIELHGDDVDTNPKG